MPERASRRIWSRRILPGMAVAATVACLWIAGPGLWLRWQADALTGAGEMLVVTLPDGSRADLNSGTALAYDFAEGRRHVTLLQGEAWLDVIHDPAHPFTVDAGATEVTVKGTAFRGPGDGGGEPRDTRTRPGPGGLGRL